MLEPPYLVWQNSSIAEFSEQSSAFLLISPSEFITPGQAFFLAFSTGRMLTRLCDVAMLSP